jgi:hypothetical protein
LRYRGREFVEAIEEVLVGLDVRDTQPEDFRTIFLDGRSHRRERNTGAQADRTPASLPEDDLNELIGNLVVVSLGCSSHGQRSFEQRIGYKTPEFMDQTDADLTTSSFLINISSTTLPQLADDTEGRGNQFVSHAGHVAVDGIPRTDHFPALRLIPRKQSPLELGLQERSVGNRRIFASPIGAIAEFLDGIALDLPVIAKPDC